MKPFKKLICALPLILLLEGCWDRTELNDLGLITAFALDKGKNNNVLVSVQIVIPQNQSGGIASGGGGGGVGGGAMKRTTIRRAEGIDTADALSKLQRVIPRKQFWGQCKVFIFGEDLAKSGIQEQLDFLLRHPQPRERGLMFVSKGKAGDALELFPPIERSSAEAIRKLSDLKIGMQVTMEQLSIMLKGESKAAALPLLYILPTTKSADPYQTIPYIFGTAVFKKDRMIGTISEDLTRGVLWINNEIREYTVTFKMKGAGRTGKEDSGNVSLKPIRASVKLIPNIQGKQWSMTIKVITEGDIIQNGTVLNPMDPELLDQMNLAYQKDVTKRIQRALDEVQHRLKTDVFHFAREFHRKYPKQWEASKDRWDEIFPKLKVNIEVNTNITRTGNLNAPGGLPLEEVKEK
ncbi:Ger(x)C family spore germination protein [Paenibacillus vulneris]|uniref:Ger(X)C family spore germination protein n=1 Tax=Paenibacillus vulneris TaxID=1133364 RepID=A0ABW3UNP2_9BACL|nr:Ger(x)C family spore germination protein [Paenibacillus sp. 32352]